MRVPYSQHSFLVIDGGDIDSKWEQTIGLCSVHKSTTCVTDLPDLKTCDLHLYNELHAFFTLGQILIVDHNYTSYPEGIRPHKWYFKYTVFETIDKAVAYSKKIKLND